MRLRTKLLVISEVVLIVAVLVLVLPVWRAMGQQVVQNMQNELKAIASTAAIEIDGDLHELIRTPGDDRTEAFRTIREKLDEVRLANGVDYDHIYTFYPDGNQVRFAVMLHPAPFIGDAYPMQPLMRPVLEHGATAATPLYKDAHGHWISGYAPIRDGTGAIVGLLEVDKSSEEYFAAYHRYTLLAACVGVIALIVSSLLGWFVLERVVIRPLAAVDAGMLALGRNDFTHKVDLHTGDEFEDLGRTFNDLARQMNVARKVHASLLPKHMPDVEGYELAGASDPCDATGGDYFDVIPCSSGRMAVVVADVSGHGLGPSLLMATCRSTLRALVASKLSPGELVDRLDSVLTPELSEGSFITMLFGVFDADGVFTYTNAGHGPAVAVLDGEVRHLAAHRPPLGIRLDDDAPMETAIRLGSGDRVILATDGVPEALDGNGRHLGVGPIERAVADHGLDCQAIVTHLRNAVRDHCDGPSTTDDVTMLCVQRVEASV